MMTEQQFRERLADLPRDYIDRALAVSDALDAANVDWPIMTTNEPYAVLDMLEGMARSRGLIPRSPSPVLSVPPETTRR